MQIGRSRGASRTRTQSNNNNSQGQRFSEALNSSRRSRRSAQEGTRSLGITTQGIRNGARDSSAVNFGGRPDRSRDSSAVNFGGRPDRSRDSSDVSFGGIPESRPPTTIDNLDSSSGGAQGRPTVNADSTSKTPTESVTPEEEQRFVGRLPEGIEELNERLFSLQVLDRIREGNVPPATTQLGQAFTQAYDSGNYREALDLLTQFDRSGGAQSPQARPTENDSSRPEPDRPTTNADAHGRPSSEATTDRTPIDASQLEARVKQRIADGDVPTEGRISEVFEHLSSVGEFGQADEALRLFDAWQSFGTVTPLKDFESLTFAENPFKPEFTTIGGEQRASVLDTIKEDLSLREKEGSVPPGDTSVGREFNRARESGNDERAFEILKKFDELFLDPR